MGEENIDHCEIDLSIRFSIILPKQKENRVTSEKLIFPCFDTMILFEYVFDNDV